MYRSHARETDSAVTVLSPRIKETKGSGIVSSKCLKENYQPNSLHPGKTLFDNKGKRKTFSDKGKLCYQQTCTIWNAREIISGSREMISEKNLNLQE